jgi:pimeloyl-ACP methyl ester carboxylesterase
VNEYPVFVPFGQERLACVLTVPDDEVLGLWVLLTGQGAPRGTQYHFQLWTEVARRLADRGLASIRMDHLGVGDSTGRLEVMEPGPRRKEEPLAVARFGMEATGARTVGFAGHCYGGTLALETAMAIPRCVGVVASHAGPPIDPKAIPALRRLRHQIRAWGPVARLFETAFGHRVLEPAASAMFGRSRQISGERPQTEEDLRRLLRRARVVFLNGDDEARYHLRLRPFLDRFLPTLPAELSERIESVVMPVKDLGGYMALEAQLQELEVIVDRAVLITSAAPDVASTEEGGIRGSSAVAG